MKQSPWHWPSVCPLKCLFVCTASHCVNINFSLVSQVLVLTSYPEGSLTNKKVYFNVRNLGKARAKEIGQFGGLILPLPILQFHVSGPFLYKAAIFPSFLLLLLFFHIECIFKYKRSLLFCSFSLSPSRLLHKHLPLSRKEKHSFNLLVMAKKDFIRLSVGLLLLFIKVMKIY